MIASTSTWQKTAVHPETMHALIRAYGEVRPSLLRHATGWPTAEISMPESSPDSRAYGIAGTGADRMSAGAGGDDSRRRPRRSADLCGSASGAEPTHWRRHFCGCAQPGRLVRSIDSSKKLRVYSICDQDDAGPWIRREFPNLFYIVQPSTQGGDEYYYATWTGISGEIYYRNGAGADLTTVTNEWLDANIRSKVPLGKLYPKFAFIMEGDTPSFLGLIDNGLNSFPPARLGWMGRPLC